MDKNVNREALVDKLCERLAVEEAGVRLYRALLDKLTTIDTLDTSAELRPRLERFAEDEARHCALLTGLLDEMGVRELVTPSARLARLEGDAFLKLVGEAETPGQLLHVLLTVELMDENAWELLVNLARDLGHSTMIDAFSGALKQEKEHLYKIRGAVARLARDEIEAASPVQE